MSDTTSVPALLLKVLFGRRIGSQKVGSLCDIPANRRVGLIHSAFARHKRHHSAWSQLIKAFGEEIVVNEEVVLVVPLVENLKIPERHIAYNSIKEAVGNVYFLKSTSRNRGLLIKLLCDTGRDGVKLHTVNLSVFHRLRKHTDEIADTAGRFQ